MSSLADKLAQTLSQVQLPKPQSQGVLTRVVGLTLEASGVNAPVGSYCDIIGPQGQLLTAEVVGFDDGKLLLMPFGSVQGIAAGFKVKPQTQSNNTAMSPSMLGRVLDGMGQPLDGGPPISASPICVSLLSVIQLRFGPDVSHYGETFAQVYYGSCNGGNVAARDCPYLSVSACCLGGNVVLWKGFSGRCNDWHAWWYGGLAEGFREPSQSARSAVL